MTTINRNPSRRELAWFGLAALGFFALVGALVGLKTGSWPIARTLWGCGLALAALYYAVPAWRRPIYVAWMTAVWPIGWLVTHLVLALAYYLVVTPAGLLLRLLGHDPMGRRFDREAESYWIDHPQDSRAERYFRQF